MEMMKDLFMITLYMLGIVFFISLMVNLLMVTIDKLGETRAKRRINSMLKEMLEDKDFMHALIEVATDDEEDEEKPKKKTTRKKNTQN